MRYYAVFDTNVLVSSLLTKHSDSATVRVVDAISSYRIVPVYNDEILAEYDEVLRRKKFPFSDKVVTGIIEGIRQLGIEVSSEASSEIFMHESDRVFYEVTMAKRKEDDAYLITGNLKHFPIQSFVITPAEMMAMLDEHD